jgi:DNA-binding transcriptional MerR regulator/effector-binding domain-containing protein
MLTVAVDTEVGIGEFSKMSYLSIKALRHYHDVGLLEPAAVDPATGYRRYTTSQVPVAHAIRRFRELEMPIDEIRLVLQAADPAAGNRAILRHLERMQEQLEQTRQTVASLQDLLSGEVDAAGRVEIRHLPAVHVVAAVDDVPFDTCAVWLEDALARLHESTAEVGVAVAGADGALYADEFFAAGVGAVTAFVPVTASGADGAGTATVRFGPSTVAVLVHDGPLADIDRTYGALGTIVAERGIGGPGPIREHYLSDTRTEVCWPVTASAAPDTEDAAG